MAGLLRYHGSAGGCHLTSRHAGCNSFPPPPSPPLTLLHTDASSMLGARRLTSMLMCFPSRKSVVTFLILLDWKNRANMVWSGKSFDAEALQINPRMPYGPHSSLNLFPINVYWIPGPANTCVTRLGKQKAGESSFAARCDYYISLSWF